MCATLQKNKILIIRLSSIGDVLQCMSVIGGIKKKFPDAEIHWFARKDIAPILQLDSRITKIWSFDKKRGLKGLWQMTYQLKKEKFTHIYDAHSNIRSNIIKLRLCPFWKRWLGIAPLFALRSKERINRILLFKFGINKFPKPFRGMISFQKPIEKWGIKEFPTQSATWIFPTANIEKVAQLVPDELQERICLVPSAAWELKRWPVPYWQELIECMPHRKFVVIGGPKDDFCQDISATAPERVINLAGKVSLMDSCFVVYKAALTISADTGFIHAADLFGKKGIFLAGPTAFGFPTGNQIQIMEEELPCRPCTKDGRGKCSQNIQKKCLMALTPQMVAQTAKTLL